MVTLTMVAQLKYQFFTIFVILGDIWEVKIKQIYNKYSQEHWLTLGHTFAFQ